MLSFPFLSHTKFEVQKIHNKRKSTKFPIKIYEMNIVCKLSKVDIDKLC